MIWIALQCGFGFECVVGDSLPWVCDQAGISESDVLRQYVEGMKTEVWNGEKRWVVEKVPLDRLQIVINDNIDLRRKIKFLH